MRCAASTTRSAADAAFGSAGGHAFDLAVGVPGVRRVINDIVLQSDPADDGDAHAA